MTPPSENSSSFQKYHAKGCAVEPQNFVERSLLRPNLDSRDSATGHGCKHKSEKLPSTWGRELQNCFHSGQECRDKAAVAI